MFDFISRHDNELLSEYDRDLELNHAYNTGYDEGYSIGYKMGRLSALEEADTDDPLPEHRR